MAIIPPDPGRPLLTVRCTRHGDYEITLRPGADAGELAAAAAGLPSDAVFVDHVGDIDARLVFRPIPRLPGDPPAAAG